MGAANHKSEEKENGERPAVTRRSQRWSGGQKQSKDTHSDWLAFVKANIELQDSVRILESKTATPEDIDFILKSMMSHPIFKRADKDVM